MPQLPAELQVAPQQSAPLVQALPSARQPHFEVTGSQLSEQQSALELQFLPSPRQVAQIPASQ